MEIPKQTAKRLVDKFTLVGLQRRNEGVQCALIAVDEILNSIKSAQFRVWHHEEMTSEFWQQVKTEIEKLA